MTTRTEARRESVRGDARWAALTARDAAADGTFYYAVETTGVYCRPSCAARTPRPENVAFFASTADAESAGFRACKRCTPDQPSRAAQHAHLVAELCRAIDASDEPLPLGELARRAGLSPHHVHRLFRNVTGLTPRAYLAARRAARVRDELGDVAAGSITEAVLDAGYGSTGRFYEIANQRLGMTPTDYRRRGAGVEIRFAIGQSSLGAILVAASARGVCAILMGDDPGTLARDLEDRFEGATLVGGDADFEALVARVIGLVEAPRIGVDLPLDVRGTAFQERVWRALQRIPAGTTVTYEALAAAIGAPRATRAVARACAANPLAVAVPCHRVVRKDGDLSGYRWGVARKRALLEREARDEPRR